MSRTATDRTFGLLWMAPIILIFFAGGFLQYVGLLSQTQSNWLALLLFGHVFLIRAGWRQIKYESLLGIFLLLIAIDYYQRNTPISYTLTYFYYIACTIIAAVSGRVYALRIASTISSKSYFKFVKIFLFIELLFVCLQKTFTEQFISLSRAPIGYIDAIFGTFFLQSDAALAAVCELLTISTFFLPCRMTDRFVVSILSLSIIFLGNSNTARVAVVLIFMLLALHSVYGFLRTARYGFNIIFSLFLIFLIPIIYGSLLGIITDLFAQATNDYYHRDGWDTSARFSPLGQMLTEGVDFFGQGALTYYNPITKEWLYNAGFSTIYSLYIDFGAAGILLYLSYQLLLVLKFSRNYIEFVIFMCVFILFMALNFALTDLTFIFSFNVILHLNYLRGKSSPYVHHKRAHRVLNAKAKNRALSRVTD